MFALRHAVQVLGFLGGEHELGRHVDVLIDELHKVLTREYPTRTEGVRVRFTFKICSGDNKALGALVKHRLGMVAAPSSFTFYVYSSQQYVKPHACRLSFLLHMPISRRLRVRPRSLFASGPQSGGEDLSLPQTVVLLQGSCGRQSADEQGADRLCA